MTLLSLLSLGGCVTMEKAPPVPTLTLAELRNEINLSEQRLQTSMEQQQKQYVQQQHLLVQLNTDVNNMKESVNKVGSKLEHLPPEPPKAMPIPTEKCPAPSQGHTVDGKLLVGEAEWIWVDAANDAFQARVDTGATTSSISAQEITIFERNGKNWVRFFLSHQEMDDKIQIEAPLVRHVRVRQASADDLDRRPVVRLTVRIGDMTEKAEFTLKDRSDMTFPVLLGREFLKDIAVVDVAREYIQPKPKLKDVK
ncbi:ATP-dependent zinc protease [Aeromonas dhakensis]|uniref:ATP-dependent zinc protease family protein n=1 Tax=Aeromonas dhakensis TaxID=196024 RepID=UPI00227A795C|nr:ATP-dependent zinc protease [Aeromonas dhakensis]WAG13529.1 ATP-dependent zinc protease [Aeromonas dhakensis]